MTVPPNEPQSQPAALPQKPEKSRVWWPFLLPLILGAGVLFQQTQQSPTPPNDTSVNTTPTPRPKPVSSPVPTIQYSIPSTILVAGDDAKLHTKPFKNLLPADNGANLPAIHARWMNAVVQAAPELFPKGTLVKSVKTGSDAEPAQVDFNAAFNAPNFWSGETKTKMAIYSIVNTLAPIYSPKGRDVSVLITVEGERLQTLGEFDISDPIAPDYSLNSSPRNLSKSVGSQP